MMKRTIFLTCCIILSMLFMPGMAFAAGNGFEELEYGDGQKLFVLLPSDFDPGQEYPSVWFMPPDGTEPQQYLDDGIDQVIRKLEDEGNVPPMIYVFPQLRSDEELSGQMQEAVKAVRDRYPAMDDASMRGAAGCGVGGCLALFLTYTAGEQKVEEKPALFAAAASHDGVFATDQNPFSSQKSGSLCRCVRYLWRAAL